MENFKLKNDITLFCVKADSFPAGIEAAHKKLASIALPFGRRNYFGLSYLYDDNILYLAAAEIKSKDESVPKDGKTYILKKGNYISIYISYFAKDISQIEKAFKTLWTILELAKMAAAQNVTFLKVLTEQMPGMYAAW